jgi:hypothetical protein
MLFSSAPAFADDSDMDAPDNTSAPAVSAPGQAARNRLAAPATCSWTGASLNDVARMYDVLMSSWSSWFDGAGQAQKWRNAPLKLQMKEVAPGQWKLHIFQGIDVIVPPYPWPIVQRNPWFHDKMLAWVDGSTNLKYVAWTSPKYRDFWAYQWFLVNPDWIGQEVAKEKSDFAWVPTLAHEFGHYVTRVGGRGGFAGTLFPSGPNDRSEPPLDRTKNINKELEADRLAGAFIASRNPDPGCVAVAKKALSDGGDRPGFTGSDPHGTPEQRVACFTYGMQHGIHPFFLGDTGAGVNGTNAVDIVGDAQRAGKVADCGLPKKKKNACGGASAQLDAQRAQRMATPPGNQIRGEDTFNSNDGTGADPSTSASGDDAAQDAEGCEPVIGPPIDTSGPHVCMVDGWPKTVFEVHEGCTCPPGMHPDQLGKNMGPHTMIWCRMRGPRT